LGALLLLAVLASLAPAVAGAVAQPKYLGAFGPDGTEATTFESSGPIATDEEAGVVYVADRDKEVLYKFDEEGNPVNWSGSEPYISDNEISGVAWRNTVGDQVAVDPQTHVIYLNTASNGLRAFEPSGEPHEFTAGPGGGTSEIPSATELKGVAVDKAGNIYASYYEFNVPPKIRIYSRSGAPLTEFEPKETETSSLPTPIRATSLAVAPDGSLYFINGILSVYKVEPSHFPINGSTTYSLGKALTGNRSEALSNDLSFSVTIDPATSRVYVGYQPIGNSFRRVDVYDEDDKLIGSLGGPGQEGEMQDRIVGLAVSGVGKRVYAEDQSEPQQVKVFESFFFPEEHPTITATSVVDLNLYTARLRAQINPNTFASTYHFEYGLEDCSLSVSACTSTAGGSIAAGHKAVAVSPQEIIGLEPGTTYHYRVVAENAKGGTAGPDKTFTTPVSGLGFQLGDHRVWEMVSPSNKHGGKILHFSQGAFQAAADGDGVAYQSVTSIEANPDGSRAVDTSTVLSRRGAERWSSKDVSPPHAEVAQLRFGGDYKAFSTNLERALLEQSDNTLLSPEASEETPYLRENTEPGAYRPLVTAKEGYANVPQGTVFGGAAGSGQSPVRIVAADPSLTHPVVNSRTPLVPEAAPGSLYQWSDGQLQPVSVLPASEGGAVVSGAAGAGKGSIRHAVSSDGSRVFWGRDETSLYVRDTATQETGRLDVAQLGPSGEGVAGPLFDGASADGTVAFFNDSRRLTVDASAPPGESIKDLYRCEVGRLEGGTLGCASLIDLSAPIEGSGEKAEVLGVAPAFADDGSRAYFVARGVLDTAPNEVGDTAVPGDPNLYLWEEGKGRRFIATLSGRDRLDWGVAAGIVGPSAAKLSAAGSPSGRYLSFMSERSLTGYDNRDAKSEEPLEEVFRYDAAEDRLECVSCNPSGASPEGQVSSTKPNQADVQGSWAGRWVAAILPAAQESEPTVGLVFHHPRVVLDNGRVFFNAVDSLVSADSNGEWDVYQYEPTGVGDCTASSEGAATARSARGCTSLVSSGTAEEEATFIDASESGDDVFFITPQRLSVLDEDFELDVYDTRVDGVPATLPVINECLGEACQPAPNPPNDPTPASAAFKGSGNVPSERCPQSKRKVIRAGSSRCVAKKHKKKSSHKAKRANSKRRAQR
jgi:hypothetical protein